MPATSTNATLSAARTSASLSARPTFTTVDVPAHPVITTTITSSGSSVPTFATVSESRGAEVPVGAIAGGASAGVVLALAVVIGWTWWGRSIKRKKAKEIKEALAVLQVRENTRKNASTLARPGSQYRPSFSLRSHQDRKVTFVPSVPVSGGSTLKGTIDSKTLGGDAEKRALQETADPRPAPPSAAEGEAIQEPELALPPPVPRRNPSRSRPPVDSTVSNAPSSFAQHRLAHQPSTVSSASAYSTQSAAEERPSAGVPSSLLLALGNEDVRRSLLANYLPWTRHRTSTASQNRWSEYTGSVYSQFDNDHPWEPVGYAIGDEEELPRR
ncbi:hypothetical protein TRAPUB_11518 [Trametes pubescens]|uniref:Uncharacterized protein n=1 Tax=Trametes pubescens TaxID=154538 RepID=A0A1M2VWF4_TRAPU|nr:hypothetical protein TRAPUB_11518 [Trametes pubescens]